MKRRWIAGLTTILATILLFASCGAPRFRPRNTDLEGRILLWHAWSEREFEALNDVIESFTTLHPNVVVRHQRFATYAEMESQFAIAVTTGLGPDLIVLPVDRLPDLVKTNAVQPIVRYMDEDTRARYTEDVLALVQNNGRIYGLPTALNTMGLYYNRNLVESPVNTLAGLLDQAGQDQNILLPTNFYDAAWGIQAFGGDIFNEDGMVILDQGGFANWLAWLHDARGAPGMIQDTNRDVLRQRFMDGEAGYYFGYARELNEIQEALGEQNVGVLTLPAGPIGGAGPFLSSDAFFFSTVSSENQERIAVELAKFITNAEQSARLMRSVNHVPANRRVRINQRLNPIVAAFAAQARAAIPQPMTDSFRQLLALGNEAYIRALESESSPVEVALSFTDEVNQANGFPPEEAPPYTCTDLGTLRLVHTWQDEASLSALDALISEFNQMCPLIIVQATQMDEAGVVAAMNGGDGNGASMAIIHQSLLLNLTGDESSIANLTPVVTPETLQRFWPIGLDAMRVQGNLYGLPLTLHTDALYYNTTLVSSPAEVLADFQMQASEGVPITLDTNFETAFWGITAFGGKLLNEQSLTVLDQGGFVEWLAWLKESRDVYGIKLTTDSEALLNQFLDGETAYYVGSPVELTRLQEALGPQLGVAVLPQGPNGSARPLVRATGLVVRASVPENVLNLVRIFVGYVSGVEGQTLIMDEANLLPVNATVTYAEDSPFAVFAQQVQSGYVVPNTTAVRTVAQIGQQAYDLVLEEGREPAEVAAEITARINEANNLEPQPTETPAEAATSGLTTVTPEAAATEDPGGADVEATAVMTATRTSQ